jgi:hypothetical protein
VTPAPCAPSAVVLRGNIELASWKLHLLRSWSLLKFRGGSLGKVTRFVIEHSEVFQLSSEETQGLERLLRSIDRRLNPSSSR